MQKCGKNLLKNIREVYEKLERSLSRNMGEICTEMFETFMKKYLVYLAIFEKFIEEY